MKVCLGYIRHSDGTIEKTYSKDEVQVPLQVTAPMVRLAYLRLISICSCVVDIRTAMVPCLRPNVV